MNFGKCSNLGKLIKFENIELGDNRYEMFFDELKKYLNENEISTSLEITKKTKISFPIIIKILKDERLEKTEEKEEKKVY